MATMKHRNNTTSTETVTGSSTAINVTGPKQTNTYIKGRGVYILESSGVYRWAHDEPIGASATEPTTFTAGDKSGF